MQQPRPSLGVPTHPQLLYTAKGHTQKRYGLSLEEETAHTDRAGFLHRAGRARVVLSAAQGLMSKVPVGGAASLSLWFGTTA